MPTLFPDQEARLEKSLTKGMAVHNRRHTKVLLATASSFALSAWLTTKGLFDKAIEAGVATNEGMVTAMMSAAVAATLVGGGTMLLFGITVEASKHQHRQIAVLAGALLPFILGISTNYAVLGNAGPPSLVYDMRDAAVAHAHYYEAATLDASGAQSAEVALLPLQASICGLAGDEKTNGILTGAAGKGAVYAAYASGCTSIQTIVATLSETITRTEERRELAKNIFADLNAIPKETSMSVFERQAMFRDQINTLRKLIEESSAENVAKRLTAQLKILETSVASLGLQDGAFGQRQSQSIQGLKTDLGLVSKTVGELLVAPTPERNSDMTKVLNAVSRISMSVLANSALIAVTAGVSICAIGLTALYLIQYVDETPSMKSLQCMIGMARPDCPRHAQNMKRLQSELDAIIAERNSIEWQLAGLRAVETAIDEMTLFENHEDPSSGLDITIGTVYKEFIDAQPMPESYFCYINLAHGVAGESRNLHFHSKSGPQAISASKLTQIGLSADTLNFGRSVCKPFLIGQG